MNVIICPHCKKRYEIPDQMLGRRVKCKACNMIFAIGTPTSTQVVQPVKDGNSSIVNSEEKSALQFCNINKSDDYDKIIEFLLLTSPMLKKVLIFSAIAFWGLVAVLCIAMILGTAKDTEIKFTVTFSILGTACLCFLCYRAYYLKKKITEISVIGNLLTAMSAIMFILLIWCNSFNQMDLYCRLTLALCILIMASSLSFSLLMIKVPHTFRLVSIETVIIIALLTARLEYFIFSNEYHWSKFEGITAILILLGIIIIPLFGALDKSNSNQKGL